MSRRSLPIVAVVILSVSTGADDPRLAAYRVAPGYKLQLAATEPMVVNPVAMTFGDDGRLFVIEWMPGGGANDRIRVLTDKDGDGKFDEAAVYMDGLELPAGLLFWDGWTYLTLGHDVVRLKDADGDGKFETREAIVTGFGNDDSHHRVSGLTMGPEGWIYITTGDSDARAKGSDGSTATVLRSGGVFRCKPDGSSLENVAFGMRNPFGNVAFDDEFHIFHTDNDNEGSAGFTGCRILHVVEGGDYGWRLREGARCCQPDPDRATWNGGRPGRLGWVAETGRGAPAGLCILNSAAFPPSTRNLLVYPDVFRRSVRAYKLKPAGATYAVESEFELLGSSEGVFRPDDAEVGPDGALYVLDWRTDHGGAGQLSGNGRLGRIYRVTWAGTKEEPGRRTMRRDRFAKMGSLSADRLVGDFFSEDFAARRAAGLELIRRAQRCFVPGAQTPEKEGLLLIEHRDKLMDFLKAPGTGPIEQRHALAVLRAYDLRFFGKLGDEGKILAKTTSDVVLRRIDYEYLGRFGKVSDRRLALALLARDEDDSQALRALAVALGRLRGLDRGRPGGVSDARTLWEELVRELDREHERVGKALRGMETDPPNQGRGEEGRVDITRVMNEWSERDKKVDAKYLSAINADLIARRLLAMTAEHPRADPFLRDGFTRGLERLGPAGIDAILKAIKSDDRAEADSALYALQGWRSTDGLGALMSEATSPAAITAEAREWACFGHLREMGPSVPPEPIVEWLDRSKTDAPARVAAIKLLAPMRERGALTVPPIIPKLLRDDDPSVRRAALELAATFRSEEVKKTLVAIIKNDIRPGDERALALVALRGYDAKELTPGLLVVLNGSKNSGLRAEVLRTIAAADFAAAAREAEGFLADPDLNLRAAAIAILGQKPETALIVARRYNEGKLPAGDLPRVIEAIRSHRTPEIQAASQQMLQSRLLAAPKGDEARRLRDYVSRRGNPDRGRAIYLDATRGGCAACHRLEGVGSAVGPDLTRVYETLDFDKRVEAILEPSKEIKEGYATFQVATADGRTLSGLLVADTGEGVTLKDAQGKEVKVPAKEVEQKGAVKSSLMPAGVVGHLSLDELADLLAFLGDRRAQEVLRTEK